MLPHRSLRTRLIIGLLLVVLLPGLIATIVGIRIMNERVVQQAQNKVRPVREGTQVYLWPRDIRIFIDSSQVG